MVDRVSALQGALSPGRHGAASGEPGVRLSERRPGAIWQVTAWPDRLAEAGAAAAAAAGLDAAPGPGRAGFGEDTVVMRTEPLRWLLVSDAETPAPTLSAEDGTLLDLGHARTVIRVEGARSVDLMARMAPLDFRPKAFPEGTVATSAIHHIAATILARTGGFDVFVYRSFGLAIFEHIAETAEQFGVEVG